MFINFHSWCSYITSSIIFLLNSFYNFCRLRKRFIILFPFSPFFSLMLNIFFKYYVQILFTIMMTLPKISVEYLCKAMIYYNGFWLMEPNHLLSIIQFLTKYFPFVYMHTIIPKIKSSEHIHIHICMYGISSKILNNWKSSIFEKRLAFDHWIVR